MKTDTPTIKRTRRGSGAVTLHDVAKLAGVATLAEHGCQLMPRQGGYGHSREDALLETIVGRRTAMVAGDDGYTFLVTSPTRQEAGVKNVVVCAWQGVVAPQGMPAGIRAKVNTAAAEALNDPTIKSQFLATGFEIVADKPEQFAAFEQQADARWEKVMATGHVTAD